MHIYVLELFTTKGAVLVYHFVQLLLEIKKLNMTEKEKRVNIKLSF